MFKQIKLFNISQSVASFPFAKLKKNFLFMFVVVSFKLLLLYYCIILSPSNNEVFYLRSSINFEKKMFFGKN